MSHCFVCLTSGNLLQCYFQERCVYNRKHTGIVLCTTFYLVHTLTLISSCALNNVIIPPMNKVKGVYRNHSVCPSVFLSVCADLCLAHNFFWFDICLPYLAHGCITLRWCVAYIHDPNTTLIFDFKVKFTGVLTCFHVQPIWHWLTIFSTCVYHHKTMCSIHSWSRFDIDLWPQGQIYRFLSCLCVQPVTSVCFDIGISYLGHGSIAMRWCVMYIHDHDTTLTFDFKVKFIGFMIWLCVQATAF